MAHEVMHALGIRYDQYSEEGVKEGWENTLMGDSHGTGVTQKDICAIAAANKACRVPGKRGKRDASCCEAYDDTLLEADGDAVPAESVPMSQKAPTTGLLRTVMFSDLDQVAAMLHAVAVRILGARSTTDVFT